MYVPLRINDMNFSLKPKVQAGTIYDVTIPVGTIFRALFTEDFRRSRRKFEDASTKWLHSFFPRSIHVNNVVDTFNMWNNLDLTSV